MTLRVGPTSLDRVDGERLQHRVSSLPLLSVEKVYLFTDDATQVGLRRDYSVSCFLFAVLVSRGRNVSKLNRIVSRVWTRGSDRLPNV